MAYKINLPASAKQHFGSFSAGEQRTVLKAVRAQLQHEPFRETRNRKQLRPNPLAPWELRVGHLRVFYEIDAVDSQLVNILAMGIKIGNRLLIGGKEVQL